MIQHGADVNAKTSDQRTALHYVCHYYQKDNLIKVIRLLIKHGADVKAKTTVGNNALALLRNNHKYKNNYEVKKLLS